MASPSSKFPHDPMLIDLEKSFIFAESEEDSEMPSRARGGKNPLLNPLTLITRR